MADGKVTIDSTVDETGITKGINNIDKKVNSLSDKFSKSFASIRDVMLGPVAAAAAIKAGIEKVKAVIDDLTNAYKIQKAAETQLETAARNNPYLSSSSVQQLKDYAGQLQSISTTGDEELLPFMAQLAAAGRTQAEIQDIMSASLDVSASGAMSLDSAVKNLNKSYSGTVGELGESIPAVKNLTAEQLKNGDAVKIVAAQYKGMALEVAKATGTSEQLKNAMGDLKEELGATFEKNMAPMRAYFTNLISNWASAKKAKREYDESIEKGKSGGITTSSDLDKQLVQLKKEKEKLEQLAENTPDLVTIQDDEQLKKITNDIIEITKRRNALAKAEKQEATAKNKAAEAAQKEKDASDYIAENTKAREAAIEKLKLQAKAEGKTVDNAELLNIYTQSYVDLISGSGGQITANNTAAKSLLDTIKEIAKINPDTFISSLTTDLNKSLEAAKATGGDIADVYSQYAGTVSATIQTLISTGVYSKDSDEIKKLIAFMDELNKKQQDSSTATSDQVTKFETLINTLNTYSGTTFDNFKQSLLDAITNSGLAADKIKELTDQINKAKSSTIDWGKSWSDVGSSAVSSLLSATEALSEAVVSGDDAWGAFASAALNGIASSIEGIGAQLASLAGLYTVMALGELWSGAYPAAAGHGIAAAKAAGESALVYTAAGLVKGWAASFETGGVIGGTSYTGDKTLIKANAKERVLTAQQNAAFEDLVYGKGSAQINNRLTTDDISSIASAVAGMYNQSVNTTVTLDKRVLAKALTTVQRNGDY